MKLKRTKQLTTLAMLSALSYTLMAVGRVPVTLFLKYDPKDIIITIGGFIFGPLSALLISSVVSLVEMVTLSETGIIGLIMNILSTVCFACTASYIYKKKHNLKGAVTGLVCGILLMVFAMLLWNYLITPLYMNVSREQVAGMLIPIFLPFNLLKGVLNAALTLLIYKPVVSGLRKAHIVEIKENSIKGKINIGLILVASLIVITCILIILAYNGII